MFGRYLPQLGPHVEAVMSAVQSRIDGYRSVRGIQALLASLPGKLVPPLGAALTPSSFSQFSEVVRGRGPSRTLQAMLKAVPHVLRSALFLGTNVGGALFFICLLRWVVASYPGSLNEGQKNRACSPLFAHVPNSL